MIAEFEDHELKDYLAGVMDPARAFALETALATDGELEARLLALEPLSAPLRQVFASVPDEARLAGLPQPLPVMPNWRRALPFGLVAGVAGLAGLFLGGLSKPDQVLSWQEQVAVYQALYVAETVAPLEPTTDDLQTQFARASDRLGFELSPSDYNDVPGLTLKRAQILGFEDRPLIQIAFAAESGAPIAFCILKTGETLSAVVTELSGLPSVNWAAEGFGYMVIGDLPEGELVQLARQFGASL